MSKVAPGEPDRYLVERFSLFSLTAEFKLRVEKCIRQLLEGKDV
jgi:hypothetical protein